MSPVVMSHNTTCHQAQESIAGMLLLAGSRPCSDFTIWGCHRVQVYDCHTRRSPSLPLHHDTGLSCPTRPPASQLLCPAAPITCADGFLMVWHPCQKVRQRTNHVFQSIQQVFNKYLTNKAFWEQLIPFCPVLCAPCF